MSVLYFFLLSFCSIQICIIIFYLQQHSSPLPSSSSLLKKTKESVKTKKAKKSKKSKKSKEDKEKSERLKKNKNRIMSDSEMSDDLIQTMNDENRKTVSVI